MDIALPQIIYLAITTLLYSMLLLVVEKLSKSIKQQNIQHRNDIANDLLLEKLDEDVLL
jgi:ATP-binding cassette subfamily A (ABC1) protein 3